MQVKTLTGRDYIDLTKNMPKEGATDADAIEALAHFCSIAIVGDDGQLVESDHEKWLDKPFSELEKYGNLVMDSFTGNTVEDAEKK